jgi:anti-sigma factor RsiW
MKCREFIEFIQRYLDGELTDEERTELQRHLDACPYCVDYLKSYERAVRLGKAAFGDLDAPLPPEVPKELVQSILASRRR